MAEFLVMAKDHWMDSPVFEPPTDPKALSQYLARSQKGDIVVVRPDGWAWGNEEKPPNYIVVKVPQIAYSTAATYEAKVFSGDLEPKLLKKYRYYVDPTWVDTVIAAGGAITLTRKDALNLIQEKTA